MEPKRTSKAQRRWRQMREERFQQGFAAGQAWQKAYTKTSMCTLIAALKDLGML